jgi:small subunit ribosomal protein S2
VEAGGARRPPMMLWRCPLSKALVKELVDSGIHFGHRASRWNPKMRQYIFGKRNLIHIIDLRETVKGLLLAKKFIARTVSEGGDVLFVGTKRQARHSVADHAKQCGMPYVTERWLGGTLTNFRTVRARLGRLEELEAEEASGKLQEFSKKAIATRTRERLKIKRQPGRSPYDESPAQGAHRGGRQPRAHRGQRSPQVGNSHGVPDRYRF